MSHVLYRIRGPASAAVEAIKRCGGSWQCVTAEHTDAEVLRCIQVQEPVLRWYWEQGT